MSARRDRQQMIVFLRVGTGQQWLAATERLQLIPRVPKRLRRKPPDLVLTAVSVLTKPET